MIEAASFKTAFLGLWFCLIFAIERVAPASPVAAGVQGARRLLRNFGLWLVVLLASPLIVLPITALAEERYFWTRPDVLLGPLGLALSILILDCFTYWAHRLYHEAPFLWPLHEPHHLDERLDASSALRFHLGEVALSAGLRLIPIMVFAIPLIHVILFETVLLASAIFHHSNVKLSPDVEQRLARVIVTPSIHWVHHHAKRKDTDSNYAAVFSVWDRLFGTASAHQRTADMPIGVEGRRDRSLGGLLIAPFAGWKRLWGRS